MWRKSATLLRNGKSLASCTRIEFQSDYASLGYLGTKSNNYEKRSLGACPSVLMSRATRIEGKQKENKRFYFTSCKEYDTKVQDVDGAFSKYLSSNQNIFIHTGCSSPQHLVRHLSRNVKERKLDNIHIHHLHINGDAPYMEKEFEDQIHVHAMFCGSNERRALAQNRKNIHYVPIFLSESPLLFQSNVIPLDVALIQVSPPDRHGFCSMGINIDCSLAAVRKAKVIIAQMNSKFPRTHGDGFIHVNAIDSIIEHEEKIFSLPKWDPQKDLKPEEKRIGEIIAQLIPDRACLQLGIGSIPNAVCEALSNHKDLGVHTEMFSDGIMNLYRKGVITNRFKTIHTDEVLTSFVMGSDDLYDFVDNNPFVIFRCASFVNDVTNIKRNDDVMAINSALEVDLTGQVCADSIGSRIYSGVGGQVDFIMGSARSKGGKPIIALPSTYRDKSGKLFSRIVSTLQSGAGVVTTRAHVHYVVTEYGHVDLYGKNIYERAKSLISIAHPEFREQLMFDAKKTFG